MNTNDIDRKQVRILVVEDDPDIRKILSDYLRRDNFSVIAASDGRAGMQQFTLTPPNLVLVDINMPHMNGFEFIQMIRRSSQVPIIVISARLEDSDKLQGLNLGADDYVVKPFNPKEVLARVHAVLRRSEIANADQRQLVHGRLKVDLEQQTAYVRDTNQIATELTLTPTEFRLLSQLITRPRKVFSRAALLESCADDGDALERTVDSHIAHLRKKLAAQGAGDYISAKRGVGYVLSEQEPEAP